MPGMRRTKSGNEPVDCEVKLLTFFRELLFVNLGPAQTLTRHPNSLSMRFLVEAIGALMALIIIAFPSCDIVVENLMCLTL